MNTTKSSKFLIEQPKYAKINTNKTPLIKHSKYNKKIIQKNNWRKTKMEENTTQDTNQQSVPPSVKPTVNQEDYGRRWFMKKQTVKDKISALDCQIGANFFPRLNEFIEDTLVKAVYRTKCNKRKTVRAMDI